MIDYRSLYPCWFNLKNLVIANSLIEVGFEFYSFAHLELKTDSYLETFEGWSLYLRRNSIEEMEIALIAMYEKAIYLLFLDDYRITDPIALTKNAITPAIQSLKLKRNKNLVTKAIYGQNRRQFTLSELGISEETKEFYSLDTVDHLTNQARLIEAIKEFKRI